MPSLVISGEARGDWSQNRDRGRSCAGPLALGNAQESFAAVFMLIASAPFHNALRLLPDAPTSLYSAPWPRQSEITIPHLLHGLNDFVVAAAHGGNSYEFL